MVMLAGLDAFCFGQDLGLGCASVPITSYWLREYGHELMHDKIKSILILSCQPTKFSIFHMNESQQ
jgi:hypothetical protein